MSELSRAMQGLRRHALRYPEAREDFPWGERTVKVRGKIFVFLAADKEQLSLTVKLPQTADAALGLPFCTPTRYRLGRSGWVSAKFPKAAEIPFDMFCDWIEESYRAVAPAALVTRLENQRRETANRREISRVARRRGRTGTMSGRAASL